MNLTTYRHYRAGYYAHLAALMTGGYVDHKATLSLVWCPGLFRVERKRGDTCAG